MAKKATTDPIQPIRQKTNKEDGGILLPILYAILAAVGAFTLTLFVGAGVAVVTGTETTAAVSTQPPSYQSTLPPQSSGQMQEPTNGQEIDSPKPEDLPETRDFESLQSSNNFGERTDQPTVPSSTPAQSSAPQIIRGRPSDTTVYISSSGKIHSISSCSGMKSYTQKTLGEANETASRGFYSYCKNCW